MNYHYRFWQVMLNPSQFIYALENEEKIKSIRGYRLRVILVIFFIVLFYMIRDLWGMGTEDSTFLFVSNLHDEYVLSRYLSAVGAAIYGLLYFLLHYYVISGCLAILTDIPFMAMKRIQLFVVVLLLTEKVILFFVFVMMGYSTELSFLSLGPIMEVITDEPFLIYLFDQITFANILMIYMQYKFLLKWSDNKFRLLIKIIFVYLIFTFLATGTQIIPLKEYFEKVVGL